MGARLTGDQDIDRVRSMRTITVQLTARSQTSTARVHRVVCVVIRGLGEENKWVPTAHTKTLCCVTVLTKYG